MNGFIIYKHVYNLEGTGFIIGGIETYLLSLAGVLIKKGIQPVIIQCANSFFEKNINGIVIRGYQVKLKNYHKSLYGLIKNEIEKEDILIWGTDTFSLKIEHKRTISIQHGIDFDYYPEEDKMRRFFLKCRLGYCFKYLQRRRALNVFRKSNFKVCVDYNFWNWYRTFCVPSEEKNIYVIPNFSYVDDIPSSDFRKDNSKKLEIVFARRFVRRRGIEVFMDVVKYFKNSEKVNFTFAGEGPYLEKIQQLEKNFSNVKVTKYLPLEAVCFHKHFDISVIPTIGSEGTSFSLLEAMAAGNVVICTSVGGMTNVVLDYYNGLFVKPNSSMEIIDKINMLLLDKSLRERLSQNAKNTIKESFSYDIWKSKWEMVIEKILDI